MVTDGYIRRSCKKISILLAFSFFVTISGYSQNIFLSDSPGLLTYGQFSQVQQFDGASVGLNYSLNGKTAFGISYGSNSLNNRNYQSVSVLANVLIKKQSEGDILNFEVMPSFERKYHNPTNQNLSLFALGTGISRDFSQRSDINLIPRASFSYLMSPSVGLTNYFSAGLDMGLGYDISSNLKLIVNPGLNVRMDTGSYNGTFTGGFLVH
ncbi:hypothetical protein G3570_13735 [Balneolaceae bacterium YR4-1]|uniref:Uncharacterized protein n=1 Tax=Halalkalibaculum roseum TaxID=2709311 RepID=A0A6M1T2G2_9BACT|nr:hypothetical protein [Halalkalibaculum roseum]NGP77704.1 hypothetical protein [Halalkalibaculum roseum]